MENPTGNLFSEQPHLRYLTSNEKGKMRIKVMKNDKFWKRETQTF